MNHITVTENSVRILREMKALLSGGWTKGAPARDAAGASVRADSPKAVSFCLIGAGERALRNLGRSECDFYYTSAFRALSPEKSSYSIAVWECQDGRTQAEVLALIDRAIEIAETEQ